MCTTTQTNWTQSVFKKTFVLLPATSFKLWCPVATLEGLFQKDTSGLGPARVRH